MYRTRLRSELGGHQDLSVKNGRLLISKLGDDQELTVFDTRGFFDQN